MDDVGGIVFLGLIGLGLIIFLLSQLVTAPRKYEEATKRMEADMRIKEEKHADEASSIASTMDTSAFEDEGSALWVCSSCGMANSGRLRQCVSCGEARR